MPIRHKIRRNLHNYGIAVGIGVAIGLVGGVFLVVKAYSPRTDIRR